MLEELSNSYQRLCECAGKTSPQQDSTLQCESGSVRGLRRPQAQGHYVSQQMTSQVAPRDITEHQLEVRMPVISHQRKEKCGGSCVCESGNCVAEVRLVPVNAKENACECLQMCQSVNV